MQFGILMESVPVGEYVSVIKLLSFLAVSILWWRILSWVDKDVEVARLPREWINLGLCGGYILGVVLFLMLPGFWLAFSVFVVLMLAEIGTYLGIRQQKVGLKDLVADIKSMKILKGGKVSKVVDDLPGLVTITTKDGRAVQVPAAETPERQAYDAIQTILVDPLRRGMERLELMPIDNAMMVQYWVDGVVYTGPQFNRASAAGAITLLKRVAGLDMNERRKPQAAIMCASVEGKKTDIQVQTAGSATGESLKLLVNPKRRHELKLDQVGLSQDQLVLVQAMVGVPDGIILVAVPRGQGLTTLLYAILRQHDAFLTHIHTIERDPDYDLEGVTQNILAKSASPADELQMVGWVTSQEPDALLIPEVQNPKSVRELIAHAAKGKRIYIGMHSATAIDAVNDFRKLVGDDDLAMKTLRMVIAGRVVRKLCPACKQPYQPDPETLRKLNLDHGKAQQFSQARTQPMRDSKGNAIPCTFCADLRYKGRTGVFEVVEVTEEVKQAVLSNASVNQLRAVFRKSRGRFVQEQALALVEEGTTSIQEVLRAMRGQEQDPVRSAAGTMAGGTALGGTASGRTGDGAARPGSAGQSGGSSMGGSRPGRPPTPGRR